MDRKKIKGISLIESLVAVVIVGIGFISVMQNFSFFSQFHGSIY